MVMIEAGQVLAGRYRIDRLVGRGGMATVYAGMDSRLGRPVAIKCLRPELSDPAARRRFEMEGRMAARLNHSNIVAVHDAGEDDRCAFLVMELLPGRTLADEMAAGPMGSDRCAEVAGQVLAALAAAHQAGVVHRDIKPSNLLLGSDDAVKVADFGIATSLDVSLDLTRTGELIGTPSYIAPERLAGASATASSDLYSLGAVLYECLTGRRMFKASSPLAYAQKVLDTMPVPVASAAPGTHPVLAAVVDRVLGKDPAGRFTTAAEMQAALAGTELRHTAIEGAGVERTEFDSSGLGGAGLDQTVGWGVPPVSPGDGDEPLPPTDVLLRPALPRPARTRGWWPAGLAAAAIVVLIVVVLTGHSGPANSRTTTRTSSPPTTAVAVLPSVPAPLANDLAGLQKAVSSK